MVLGVDVEHDYHDSSSVAQKQNMIPFLYENKLSDQILKQLLNSVITI